MSDVDDGHPPLPIGPWQSRLHSRGALPQRWEMWALWRAQDLRCCLPKPDQVRTASKSRTRTLANAADKLAVSKATATYRPAPALGKRQTKSWAFHRALICHRWGLYTPRNAAETTMSVARGCKKNKKGLKKAKTTVGSTRGEVRWKK